jgi:hypothetical protein
MERVVEYIDMEDRPERMEDAKEGRGWGSGRSFRRAGRFEFELGVVINVVVEVSMECLRE